MSISILLSFDFGDDSLQQLPEPERESKRSYGSTDEHIEYNDGEADVTQELRFIQVVTMFQSSSAADPESSSSIVKRYGRLHLIVIVMKKL